MDMKKLSTNEIKTFKAFVPLSNVLYDLTSEQFEKGDLHVRFLTTTNVVLKSDLRRVRKLVCVINNRVIIDNISSITNNKVTINDVVVDTDCRFTSHLVEDTFITQEVVLKTSINRLKYSEQLNLFKDGKTD